MAKIPSSLISRWANFGYDRDSWQESLLDFLYFINDPADPDTPLPPPGSACIIGQAPVGSLASYSPNDILFHSSDPDEYFIKKPDEIRIMIQRDGGTFWFWDSNNGRWYAAGNLNQSESIYIRVVLTSSVWNSHKIELSRPVLDIPPYVYLVGSGELLLDINYWMPDVSTIVFDPSMGPDSLGKFPIAVGSDFLQLRYRTTVPVTWGG